MKKDLLKVSIRQNAIYLPPVEGMGEKKKLTSTTVALVAQLRKMGYGVSEELLHTINEITPAEQMEVFQVIKLCFSRRRIPPFHQWCPVQIHT